MGQGIEDGQKSLIQESRDIRQVVQNLAVRRVVIRARRGTVEDATTFREVGYFSPPWNIAITALSVANQDGLVTFERRGLLPIR